MAWLLLTTACSNRPSDPADVGGPSPAAGDETKLGESGPGTASAPLAPPAVVAPAEPPFFRSEPLDLLVRGGEVIDGLGGAPVRADVAVDDGRVIHVGVVREDQTTERTIDASGRMVTPGFIDTHSHHDPGADGAILNAMGVTTVVVGQDGTSPPGGVRSFLDRMERTPRTVHVATLSGHRTLRSAAGVSRATPSPAELEKLATSVRRDLAAGAFGLSFGLEYLPSGVATGEELATLAEPVAERDGIVMTHLRSEDDEDIESALQELIEQGRASGARVHVAHIKVVKGRGAERGRAIVELLEAARSSGVELTADWYPYEASYTTIAIVFPDFAKGDYTSVKRDQRPRLAEALRRTITERGGPERTLFGTGTFAGSTLAEAAAARGLAFEDLLIDHVGPGGASAAYFVMDTPLQHALFAAPFVMVGSDGSGAGSHPRGHGSFARVLGQVVRQHDVVSLAEAVRKMTSLPAKTLRLDQRGVLAPGHHADLVIFDPATITDHATFETPHRASSGVDAVLVDGEPVWLAGAATGAHPGTVLRHAGADSEP